MASKTNETVAPVSNDDVVDTTTGELVRMGDTQTAHQMVASQVASLTSGTAGAISTTLKGATTEDRKALYTALNDAEKMSDHLNEEFVLRHVVAQAIEIVDSETQELIPATRTVLITEDGKAYAAVSNMLFQSVQNIIGIFGQPSEWPEGIRVKIVQKSSNNARRFYVISLV